LKHYSLIVKLLPLFWAIPFIPLNAFAQKYDLIIENVTLFDGDNVFTDADIYVSDDIVRKIETNLSASLKAKCKQRIDGKGKTLIPGLINAHVHAFSSIQLKEAASAGVLTLIDLFNAEDSLKHLKSLGNTPHYAYFYSSGICATAPNGHGTEYGFPIPTLTQASEVKSFINNRITNGADYIKIMYENRMPVFSPQIFKEVVKEAHVRDRLVVAHIGSLTEATFAFKSGADILAHIWLDSIATDNQLALFKQREFYVTPTLTVYKRLHELKKRPYFPQLLMQVEKLHKEGITLLAGTDPPNFAINYGSSLFEELEYFVAAGLSPFDALQTATVNVAKAFRLKDKGTIKTGSSADLVLINGDVLKDIRNLHKIESVWKQGKKIR